MKVIKNITAKVEVTDVLELVKSEKSTSTWRTWRITINQRRYTSEEALPIVLKVISPNSEFTIRKGDTLSLIKTTERTTWMLNESDPFTAKTLSEYVRDTSTKKSFDLMGEEISLYKYPDMNLVDYFEVRPIVAYYNEITGEQICDIIRDSHISFEENFDQILWGVFEVRSDGNVECIGDWERAWTAHLMHLQLSKALKVTRKLS